MDILILDIYDEFEIQNIFNKGSDFNNGKHYVF